MTTPALIAQAQQLAVGELVELFILDATPIGGERYYFTQARQVSSSVSWNGNVFTPIDVEVSGFSVSGRGTVPTPHVRVSNVNNYLAPTVIQYNDGLGAYFTRIRTLSQFLDGGSMADSNAVFPTDVYKVERKVQHNKFYIEWELSALIDQQGAKLPRRQVLRDTCTHVYRKYNPSTGDFDYSAATCPYTGSNYFDSDGNATTIANDACSKLLSGCQDRFGASSPLYTRAFPGVGRAQNQP